MDGCGCPGCVRERLTVALTEAATHGIVSAVPHFRMPRGSDDYYPKFLPEHDTGPVGPNLMAELPAKGVTLFQRYDGRFTFALFRLGPGLAGFWSQHDTGAHDRGAFKEWAAAQG